MKAWAWIALGLGAVALFTESVIKAVGYFRGQPFDLELAPIGQGFYLSKPAAQAFNQMAADALAQGVSFTIDSAFRTMDEQTDLKTRLGAVEPVAVPGWSNHQSGTAVDIDSANGTNAAFQWLTANASTYGFSRTVPAEPWHWDFA